MKWNKSISWIMQLIFVASLLSSIAYAVPNIFFYSQIPSDTGSFNLFNTNLNITFNITSPLPLDSSGIKMYYKTNTSDSDCFGYVNQSRVSCGYVNRSVSVNSSDFYEFRIFDANVYPGTYNLDERSLELTTHNAFLLNSSTTGIKMGLFNVSNAKQYSIYEVMANNTNILGTQTLRIYYCNSSYVSGTVSTTPNCILFYNVPAQTAYNHSHSSFSSHLTVPMTINTTTGRLGTVYVTPTSYFVLLGRTTTNAWNAMYVNTVSRPDTIQTTTNTGSAWSNFAGTIDSHIHQYDGTDTLYYYACANDTSGNQACTPTRADLINLAGIPPTAPTVNSPLEGNYKGNITISYGASQSPNGYAISYYNLTLRNLDYSFNKTIFVDSTSSLNYSWNTLSTSDGRYVIKVEACDVMNQCSSAYSENFSIDMTPPSIAFVVQDPSDIDSTNLENGPLKINYSISDATSGVGDSGISIWYTTNSTLSNDVNLVNGTVYKTGFVSAGQSLSSVIMTNANPIWSFLFQTTSVYPAVYNMRQSDMEKTAHTINTLGSSTNYYFKIQFLNVSGKLSYNYFEIMANTSGTGALMAYYCNSSYSTEDPSTSSNCYNFNSISPSSTFRHYHYFGTYNNSAHQLISMPINSTSETIDRVKVTPVSYILLRGAKNGVWNLYGISNVSRTDAIQYSSNKGSSWTSQAYTLDAHIHQFDGDSFYYYLCANDSAGNSNCSPTRQDLMEHGNLPPTSPIVYSPAEGNYSGNISIAYLASESMNGYPIVRYNISIHTPNLSNSITIVSNNSANLSYTWDSNAIADGEYVIHVEACDSENQCKEGDSANIMINNKPPAVTINYPANNGNYNISSNSSINFNWNLSDAVGPSWICNLSVANVITVPGISSLNGTNNYSISGFTNGTYRWNVTCKDNMNNANSSLTASFSLLDNVAPGTVSGLTSSVTSSSITWSWTNPSDNDLDYHIIYIDDSNVHNTSSPSITSYTASGLNSSTNYTIRIKTIDYMHNINNTLVNNTASTSAYSAPQSSGGNGGGSSSQYPPSCGPWSDCRSDNTKTQICIDAYNSPYSNTMACEYAAPISVKPAESISITENPVEYTSHLNQKIEFSYSKEQHSIVIDGITSNSAEITVMSTPKKATIKLNETKEFDINDDGTKDLSVTLKKIINQTEIVLKMSLLKQPVKEAPKAIVPEAKTNLEQQPAAIKSESPKAPSMNVMKLTVGLSSALLLIVLLAIIFRRQEARLISQMMHSNVESKIRKLLNKK